MPTFNDGIGDDYLAYLGDSGPANPSPGISGTDRLLYYLGAAVPKAVSNVGESLANITGQPSGIPPVPPEYQLPPGQTTGQKAIDLIGGLLPVGAEIAATGGAVRGLMGAAAATRPLAARIAGDAAAFGLLGAQESTAVGAEQAAEGGLYGALTALPRMKRVLPAAALAGASKLFFDWEGEDKVAGDFSRGDINAVAGFLTSFLPGRPRVPGAARYLGPEALPDATIPPSEPLQLGYTAPPTRPLLPLGGADDPYAPVTDFNATQFTQQAVEARVPVPTAPIAMSGSQSGPPIPGVLTDWDLLPPDVRMQTPEAMAKIPRGQNILEAQVLNQELEAAMASREMQNRAVEVMRNLNPEGDINPQRARIADLPEYRRSEGGFMNEEAAHQLALAGGRGLIGALFGGSAAHFDDNPETNPAMAAALGAAAFAFGPAVTKSVLQRLQSLKALETPGPLNRQAGTFLSPAGQSNLTASIKKNVDDAMMMSNNDPQKAATFLERMATAARTQGNLDAASNFDAAVADLKKNLPGSVLKFDTEAIRRRNIEQDGKIWAEGQLVNPTESNIAIPIAQAKLALKESEAALIRLKAAQKSNAQASIPEIRRMLPADAGETTWDQAIKRYEYKVEDARQYIQDLTNANKVFSGHSLQSLQKGEAGFVMPEMNAAMARAAVGGVIGSFAGAATDDPDERGGMVIGALIGAGAAMAGPAFARSAIRAMSQVKVPTPPAGKASPLKDWVNTIKNLSQTIEENAGATITRGSTRVADRLARVLSRNLELNLPQAVKSKLLEAKGMASLFLDQIDASLLKVALTFDPDPIVKDLATKYLDGTIDRGAFLQQLQPQITANPQVGNYAKFIIAGREATNGLQRMLVSGMGSPKLQQIVNDSIGKYLTRSYRIFTDKAWMPEESSVQNLIADLVNKQVWKGANRDDIENMLRQYIREVKTTKGVYNIAGFSPGTKINQAILKERQALSKEWKEFLGEITDPTERLYQTIFRLRPMAEASKYFESLIKLDVDGMPQVFRNYAEKEAFKSKLLQQLQSATSDSERVLINQKLSKLAAFQNVENHPKFGAIQGHIVSLPVWDTLHTFDSATNTFNSPLMRSLVNAHTLIKLGRTAFNPITVIRNIMTMPTFMAIARTNVKDMAEAWDIVKEPNHRLREEILRQGIANVDQVKTEFFKEFENITGSKYNFGNVDLSSLGLGKIDLDIAEKVSRRGVRGILDFYRLPDNLVRIGAYISSKRRIAEHLGRGMDDPEVIAKATEFTNRYTMNYDAVAPIIKKVRNVPFSNLFITYTAEMARIGKNLMADVVQGQGGNLARHDRMYAAFPLATVAILPEMLEEASEADLSPQDRADWERAKKLMPDYSRTRFRFVTGRDPKTKQYKYIDITPLIASDSFNQMARAVGNGDTEAAVAVNPFISWDNTPALNLVAEQIAGKDKRTHREFRGGADRVAAIAKEVLPPYFPGGSEYVRARQAHTETASGELGLTNLKTGLRLTPSDFWATYFGPLAGQIAIPGTKVGTLSLGVLEQRVTQEIKNEVANETAYLNDVLKSDANDEMKSRAVERFKDAIANLQANYAARLGVRSQ